MSSIKMGVGDICELRGGTVYCSGSTGVAFANGKVVSMLFDTTALWNPTTRLGFGMGVDYALDSSSVVVGVLWGGSSNIATAIPSLSMHQCVTRGPIAGVYGSGTVAAKALCHACIVTTLHGYVDDAAYSATYPFGAVGWAIGTVATAVTGTINFYVHTTFG